jgi:branched-chain amino acid transport system permease protein
MSRVSSLFSSGRSRALGWPAWGAPVIIFGLIAAIPLIVTEPYSLGRYQLILIYSMLALGMNFQLGFGGQFALGQGVAMGVAAYASGLCVLHLGISTELSLLIAVLTAIVTNVLLSLPSLRLNGWYLALATIFAAAAFPEIVRAGPDWLGSDIGIGGIAPVDLAGTTLGPIAVYLMVVVLLALCWILVRNIVHSGWGIMLGGLRDSPPATLSVGIRPGPLNWLVYLVSAVPLGLAGGMLAQINQYVSAQSYGLSLTNLALASVLLGGPGTLWGPLAGTAVLQGVSFFFDPFSPLNGIFLGVALIVTRIVLPGGLVAAGAAFVSRRKKTKVHHALALSSDDPGSLPPAIDRAPREALGAPALAVQGISCSFGGNHVLKGVGIEVRAGQIVALVGSNGSGKTTLLNTITGFVRPQSGEVRVAGVDVSGKTPFRVARAGVRRTFQVPRLVPQATVRQNVELGLLVEQRASLAASIMRTPAFRRIETARGDAAGEVCRWLGFPAQVIDQPAGQVSLGLKRIIEIGRAVASGPVVVCLDEPAAGLNDDEIGQLGKALHQLADAGVAVLLIEHNVRFVLEISDTVHLLKDGRIADTANRTAGRNEPLPPALAEYVAWGDVEPAVLDTDPRTREEGVEV